MIQLQKSMTSLALALVALASMASCGWAQKSKFGGDGLGGFGLPKANFGSVAAPAGNVAFSASYQLENGSRKGRLTVNATIAEGWHLYSTTQAEGGPKPSVITVTSDFLKVTGPFTADKEPEIGHAEDIWPGLALEEMYGKVNWTAPFELSRDVDPKTTDIEVEFDGQICQESCIPVTEKFVAKFSSFYGSTEKTTELRAKNTHAVWTAKLAPSQLKPGQSGSLIISAKTDDGYHVYPFIADTASTDFRTLIVVTQRSGLKFGPPATAAATELVDVGADKPVAYHVGPVEWSIPIRVPESAKEGQYPVEVSVGFFTCNEQSCDPPNGVAFSGTIEVAANAAQQSAAMVASSSSFAKVADLPEQISWIAKDEVALAAPVIALNIWHVLGAIVGGFILNFMPCVLPVVGLKLMSFVNQAGTSRLRVVTLNLAFVGGILAVMLILAAVTIAAKLIYGQTFGWGQQFERLDFQVGLAMLVFAMALSFLGVWEIPIPGFATSSKSGELMAQEGHLGAFLKGILTTVLATPCSGPFLGAIFGITLSLAPTSIVILYLCLGIGLGLPYLGLCLYPGFVKLLPKPGAWMDTLKQVLAFPLLLTVVYLVQVVEPDYRIATLILLIVVWFACWLIGQVPAYSDAKQIRRSWMIAATVVALGAVVSFNYFGPIKHHLNWEPFNEAQLAQYRAQGKTVMIEFTARWCLTCQTNMRTAIDRPEVGEFCKQNDIVTMLADKSGPSPHIEQKLQELGSNSIPLVAIYPGQAEPRLLRDVITQSQLLAALKDASQGSAGQSNSSSTATGASPADEQQQVATKQVSTHTNTK